MKAPLCMAMTALALTGCGDALQEAGFVGAPLAVLDGVVDQAFGPLTPVPDGTRIDLFWQAGDQWIQTRGPAVGARDGIAWRIAVYEIPPAEARTRGWALGRVVPFRDDDGDGRRSAAEPFLADPGDPVVLWSPSGLAAGEAGQVRALPAGLHRLVGFVSCAGAWPVGDETCSATFAKPCSARAQNAGGMGPGGGGPGGGPDGGREPEDMPPDGSSEDEPPMQAGPAALSCDPDQVCEVRDRDTSVNARCLYLADGCAPETGRLVPLRIGGALVARWVEACETDDDCRVDTACSAATGTCVDENRGFRIEVASAPAAPLGCVDLEAL